jgi:hypothetical protein
VALNTINQSVLAAALKEQQLVRSGGRWPVERQNLPNHINNILYFLSVAI